MVETGTEKHQEEKKGGKKSKKRKDCGKMEGNGEACSFIKLYKTEPMIYSTGTAKTQQLESGERLRESNAALCRNSRGTLSMPWQFQQATVEKQVESKTVTLICLYSLPFQLSPHQFCYLPISFLSHKHTHTHVCDTFLTIPEQLTNIWACTSYLNFPCCLSSIFSTVQHYQQKVHVEVTLCRPFALQVGQAEVPQDHDETGYQDHCHRNWQDRRQVVDWTVWTLTAPTHFTDVQQVRVQRVKDGLVETFCNTQSSV